MWNDTPYDETCPCCDRQMAWKQTDYSNRHEIHVKCFGCGHQDAIVHEYEESNDDDESDEDESEED